VVVASGPDLPEPVIIFRGSKGKPGLRIWLGNENDEDGDENCPVLKESGSIMTNGTNNRPKLRPRIPNELTGKTVTCQQLEPPLTA
jgi:hypothetical protein